LTSPEVVRTEQHVYDGLGGTGGGSSTTTTTTTTSMRRDGLSGGGGGSSKQTKTVTHSKSHNIDNAGMGPTADYFTHGEEGYGRYGKSGRVMTDEHGNIVKYSQKTTTGGYWRTGADGQRTWITSNNSGKFGVPLLF
jgi:hypothetical protein